MKIRNASTLALSGLIALAGTAHGEITGAAFRCDAWAPDGVHGYFEIPADAGEWNNDVWAWATDEDYHIYADDGSGRILGTMGSMNVRYVGDPQISLGFLAQAAAVDTIFSISSGILSFPTLDAEGRASAGITLTDNDGNGATLTGGFGGKSYQARFNGPTVFGSLVSGFGVGGFTSLTNDESNPGGPGFLPMSLVSDMQAAFSFTLSANDSASGTSIYVIREVPAPGALSLVGLAGLVATRRRR